MVRFCVFSGAAMKRLAIAIATIAVIGTPAFAADMAVKAPAPAPAPAPTWTGFYAGIQFGGGWSDEAVNFSPNDSAAVFLLNGLVEPGATQPVANGFRIPQSGLVGGFEAGYNWQAGSNWLLGLEADFSFSGMDGRASGTSLLAPGFTQSRPRTGTGPFVGAWAGSRHRICCCSVPVGLLTVGWTVP